MTSLKVKYANEIAEAMAKTLGDNNFTNVFYKQAVLNKEAGPALEAYKRDLENVTDENGLIKTWNKYLSSIQEEENIEEGTFQDAVCAQAVKARELGIYGYQVPGCSANDAWDQKHISAANLTLNKLTDIANTLDNNGFSKIADIIDDTMHKIAKYKTWKGKGEKPPKGAEHKAPKGWFDKMIKEIKNKNPDFSAKRVREIVGDIWDNELTNKKREEIYKRYGKTKNPNE